jgi:hypothetical protein
MIENDVVFAKTELGTDEILRRSAGLPNDLRSLLLLIDGKRDVDTLRRVSISIRESLAPLLFLEDNGFIVRLGQAASATVVPMAKRPLHPVAVANAALQFRQAPSSDYVMTQPQVVAPAQAPVPAPAQQAPPLQAPPQAMQSQAPRPYMATEAAYNQANPPAADLNELRGALIQFVSAALGADGAHAIGRIQTAANISDLQAIARRIYEILKDYSGVRTAEKFMQQFEGPLRLRQ